MNYAKLQYENRKGDKTDLWSMKTEDTIKKIQIKTKQNKFGNELKISAQNAKKMKLKKILHIHLYILAR